MDEEKRQENTQIADGISGTVEQTGSIPMSAETNLPNEEVKPQDAPTGQEPTATEGSINVDIAEVEPFDLSPESASSETEPMTTAAVTNLQAKVDELTQQVDALKAQLEDRNSQYMRLAADFENYRKRTQKEKEDQEQSVKCSTIKELLPVVDNF